MGSRDKLRKNRNSQLLQIVDLSLANTKYGLSLILYGDRFTQGLKLIKILFEAHS